MISQRSFSCLFMAMPAFPPGDRPWCRDRRGRAYMDGFCHFFSFGWFHLNGPINAKHAAGGGHDWVLTSLWRLTRAACSAVFLEEGASCSQWAHRLLNRSSSSVLNASSILALSLLSEQFERHVREGGLVLFHEAASLAFCGRWLCHSGGCLCRGADNCLIGQ